MAQHRDIQERQCGKCLIVRRRGDTLLRREKREKLAHVLDAELPRMPATEMADEPPNPMHVRGNRSFAEAALTPTTPHLLEKPVAALRIGRADQLRGRDQHRVKLTTEKISLAIISTPGEAASSQFLAPGATGKYAREPSKST